MKRLIRLAARLYPRPWRERYGVEFAALLEDLKPDLRTSLDIVKGALLMQLTSWNVGKTLAVSGLLGALVAFGASFAMPRMYLSQAVVKITPVQAALPAYAIDQEVTNRINSMSQIILSRTRLTTIINKFALYKTERSLMPIEDVLGLMRKNILIRPVDNLVNTTTRVPAFVIQFSYEDRNAAQRVTQDLVAGYIDENVLGARPVLPMTLELLDPASLPVNPISPRPFRMTAMGLAVGLALGAVGAYVRHAIRPMLAPSGILEKNSTGTPVFRGTGVPVHTLLEYLESDKTLAQFLNDFPTVTKDAAVSALELAKSFLVR